MSPDQPGASDDRAVRYLTRAPGAGEPGVLLRVQQALAAPDREALALALGALALEQREALDAVAELARQATGAQRAIVNVVLVDKLLHRGRAPRLDGGATGTRELGFCPFAVATGRALALDDIAADPDTCENPVAASGVRGYLAAPLLAGDGLAVGTLCVLDDRPRRWRQVDVERVVELAASAAAALQQAALLS